MTQHDTLKTQQHRNHRQISPQQHAAHRINKSNRRKSKHSTASTTNSGSHKQHNIITTTSTISTRRAARCMATSDQHRAYPHRALPNSTHKQNHSATTHITTVRSPNGTQQQHPCKEMINTKTHNDQHELLHHNTPTTQPQHSLVSGTTTYINIRHRTTQQVT